MDRKIGFIGAGNMGEALIRGLLSSRLTGPKSLFFHDPEQVRTETVARRYGVKSVGSNRDLGRRADILFMAVKPQSVKRVLGEIGAHLDKSKLLISVAAGISLPELELGFKAPVRLVRAMPNTPALVGRGATAVCYGRRVRATDKRFIVKVFEAVGLVVELEEELMDAVTGLSGSGPAYIFTAIQALADGGVQAGLPRKVALLLAAQTVLGAGSMVLETSEHPIGLRDRVASPGGTTMAGLAELEERNFQAALMAAVRSATERSRQLSNS